MFSAPSRKTPERRTRECECNRCSIDADSLFDFVGTFTRREFSLVSLFAKARVRIECRQYLVMLTTQLMVFPKISLSHLVCCVRAVTAREIKFNWAILGFVLVCCFFPSLTNKSFSFPKPLHFTSNSLSRKGKFKG